MVSRRLPTASAPRASETSTFDRLTFTVCMLTVALTVGILSHYGPAAAMRHIGDVLHDARPLPTTEADLYGLSAMPF